MGQARSSRRSRSSRSTRLSDLMDDARTARVRAAIAGATIVLSLAQVIASLRAIVEGDEKEGDDAA